MNAISNSLIGLKLSREDRALRKAGLAEQKLRQDRELRRIALEEAACLQRNRSDQNHGSIQSVVTAVLAEAAKIEAYLSTGKLLAKPRKTKLTKTIVKQRPAQYTPVFPVKK